MPLVGAGSGCATKHVGSSFVEFQGCRFWVRDGKIEILSYLMACTSADRRVVEPWLADAAAHWRRRATAGFQGAVDAGLDGLIGSDPDRVGVLAELVARVEQDLRNRTVIASADLAGAGVGGPGTQWPPRTTQACRTRAVSARVAGRSHLRRCRCRLHQCGQRDQVDPDAGGDDPAGVRRPDRGAGVDPRWGDSGQGGYGGSGLGVAGRRQRRGR
jgi:hypothetical protein